MAYAWATKGLVGTSPQGRGQPFMRGLRLPAWRNHVARGTWWATGAAWALVGVGLLLPARPHAIYEWPAPMARSGFRETGRREWRHQTGLHADCVESCLDPSWERVRWGSVVDPQASRGRTGPTLRVRRSSRGLHRCAGVRSSSKAAWWPSRANCLSRLRELFGRSVDHATAYRWVDGGVVLTSHDATRWYSDELHAVRVEAPAPWPLTEWARLRKDLYFDGARFVGPGAPSRSLSETGRPYADGGGRLYLRASKGGMVPLDPVTLQPAPPGVFARTRDRLLMVRGWLLLALVPSLLMLAFELPFRVRRRALRGAPAGEVRGADERWVFVPNAGGGRSARLRPEGLSIFEAASIAIDGPVPCVVLKASRRRDSSAEASYRDSALDGELRGHVVLGGRRALLATLEASHARFAPFVLPVLGLLAIGALVWPLAFLLAALRL